MKPIDAERLECLLLPPEASEDFTDGVEWLLDYIDNLPTIERYRAEIWHAVGRFLPTKGREVLACDINDGRGKGTFGNR